MQKKPISIFNLLLVLLMVTGPCSDWGARAQQPSGTFAGHSEIVKEEGNPADFHLFSAEETVPVFIDEEDEPGIARVAGLFQEDIQRVSGHKPQLIKGEAGVSGHEKLIITGTVENNRLIRLLAENGKIDIDSLRGAWEAYLITTVEQPVDGVDEALVIAGSDKRGAMYGMFELSEQMGVSPWYWWADVPVRQREKLFVKEGRHFFDGPKVKYRGIFINDEEPALGGWVREKFGDFNADFYENVFELILRMKGNFLWPAMWGKAFYDDDRQNAELADEYGVVIGFSHHEPMMRSHVEWERYGEGPWDYSRNPEELRDFWEKGIERMDDNENIVTIGMRGDGDEPMSDDRNIELLSTIIEDQREILEDVTGQPAENIPQIWALYKEVQEYYDQGMRVADDVTLLYCDDNWGNVRRVPGPEERKREGGSGMYYHFDYVGGPRSYKWINTNPLPRIWEQMNLSWEHGIEELWIVNVGDIKPMEFPTRFFLDMAWDPEKYEPGHLDDYTRAWAARQFGEDRAADVARFLKKYAKYNSRRTPELLDADTYSLDHYREFERVVRDYNRLAQEARQMYETLPENMKDAFYQLVLYPVEASANLNHLYYATALNRRYSEQGRSLTNEMADSVQVLFDRDAELTDFYHNEMADGKWNHMMAQTHIGYTYWQQPEENKIPDTKTIEMKEQPDMGVAVEGSGKWWPKDEELPTLPETDIFSKQKRYVEIFNRGEESFEYSVKPEDEWLEVEKPEGVVEDQVRLEFSVDWDAVPAGEHVSEVAIHGGGDQVSVKMPVRNPGPSEQQRILGFLEANGYISIEAENFTGKTETDSVKWMVIPDLGRTGSSVTIDPVDAETREPGNEMVLEYPVHLTSTGQIRVEAFFSPTLNYPAGEGLKYAVGFNEEEPVVANIHEDEEWEQWVARSINISTTEHTIQEPGNHVLKFYMVDPGLVLQKIVIDTGGLKPSYLGPPESRFIHR
ncbi:MAG: glycosyl hydrolase 115 family protein, partial [Marinilabiliaceae bacterium]